MQSVRILEKAKELARANQKFHFLTQAIALEKRIEGLHITRRLLDRSESLAAEAIEVSQHIDMVARLSNLALRLYGWWVRYGHARNEEDEAGVKQFMKENLPSNAWKQTGFYEKLYFYQSYAWYAFIRQDFCSTTAILKNGLIFFNHSLDDQVETGHYIKDFTTCSTHISIFVIITSSRNAGEA